MAVGGSLKMKAERGGELQDEAACLDGRMRVKPARNAFARAGRIIHHIQWQYPPNFLFTQVLLLCWNNRRKQETEEEFPNEFFHTRRKREQKELLSSTPMLESRDILAVGGKGRSSETSSSNLCIAWHSRHWHVLAFTAGNPLPANRSNTIELEVGKEHYSSLLFERSKSGNVDPTQAPNKERLSSPCMNDRG